MEKVWCIAKTSFVNRWTGSVNTKQRLLLDTIVAEQFVELQLVDYEAIEVEPFDAKKSSQSQQVVVGTQDKQSASLPVETVLPKTSLPKQNQGKKTKTGK